jgi:opacity protein-like surface antigen
MKLFKISSIFLISSFLLGLSTSAQAEDSSPVRFYIGTKLGISLFDLNDGDYYYHDYDYYYDNNIDTEEVFTINPFIGIDKKWNPHFGTRFEIEGFFHSEAKFNYNAYSYNHPHHRVSAKVNTNGVFFNTYVDILSVPYVTPYFGIGLGYATIEYKADSDTNSFTKNSDNFAIHTDVGGTFKINDNFALDASIRYTSYGDVTGNEYYSEIELDSVDILGGVRYTF